MKIPTNEKLKKSLDRLKDAYNNKLTVDLTLHDYHIEINDLIDLASAYLEVSGFLPKQKEIYPCDKCTAGDSSCRINCRSYEDWKEVSIKNQAHDEFTLWLLKKLEGLEEVLKKLDMECSIVLVRQPNIVAESIRKHFGGEGK